MRASGGAVRAVVQRADLGKIFKAKISHHATRERYANVKRGLVGDAR